MDDKEEVRSGTGGVGCPVAAAATDLSGLIGTRGISREKVGCSLHDNRRKTIKIPSRLLVRPHVFNHRVAEI